jgi:hypothetical protein
MYQLLGILNLNSRLFLSTQIVIANLDGELSAWDVPFLAKDNCTRLFASSLFDNCRLGSVKRITLAPGGDGALIVSKRSSEDGTKGAVQKTPLHLFRWDFARYNSVASVSEDPLVMLSYIPCCGTDVEWAKVAVPEHVSAAAVNEVVLSYLETQAAESEDALQSFEFVRRRSVLHTANQNTERASESKLKAEKEYNGPTLESQYQEFHAWGSCLCAAFFPDEKHVVLAFTDLCVRVFQTCPPSLICSLPCSKRVICLDV